MGGGLREGQPGMLGCKETVIEKPSAFSVLGEKDDVYAATHHYFADYRDLCIEQVAPVNGFLGMSQDTHDNNSNYLFADNHIENIGWKQVTWGMFTIRDDGYYDAYTVLNR
jgi:prepilin-type processing-associated H-X9-DG protein